MRPPLSHDRLSELPDGRLRLALKTPCSDGSTAIVLQPHGPNREVVRPWAWLLKRVLGVDLQVCPRCAGRMRILEVALTADAIHKALARQGLAPQPPPRPRAEACTGQLGLPCVP
ncbi:MAG TPA: hypothetical protein VIW78_07350, partial [Burkholderiales bacterium]